MTKFRPYNKDGYSFWVNRGHVYSLSCFGQRHEAGVSIFIFARKKMSSGKFGSFLINSGFRRVILSRNRCWNWKDTRVRSIALSEVISTQHHIRFPSYLKVVLISHFICKQHVESTSSRGHSFSACSAEL